MTIDVVVCSYFFPSPIIYTLSLLLVLELFETFFNYYGSKQIPDYYYAIKMYFVLPNLQFRNCNRIPISSWLLTLVRALSLNVQFSKGLTVSVKKHNF